MLHQTQSHAASESRRRRQPDPIVTDLELHRPVLRAQPNVDPARACVPRGVGHGFLCDAVQVRGAIRVRQAQRPLKREFAGHLGILARGASEPGQRGGEVRRIDGHRYQSARQRLHVAVDHGNAFGEVGGSLPLARAGSGAGGERIAQVLPEQRQGGELLLDAIVEFLTDALLLEGGDTRDLLLQ